ncbi:hypothetical protein [Variovorax boronicumulans]
MAKDSRQQAQMTTAKGEGLRVPFKVQHSDVKNGITNMTGQVGIENIDAPDRRFVADSFEIRAHPAGFGQWLFGQTQVDGKTLRALLDVRFPAHSMESVAVTFQRFKFESPAASDVRQYSRAFETEPPQTIALEANLMRINATRHSAVMDFYYTSGFGTSQALGSAHIFVLPVVRVQMPYDLVHLISQEVQAKFLPKSSQFEVPL